MTVETCRFIMHRALIIPCQSKTMNRLHFLSLALLALVGCNPAPVPPPIEPQSDPYQGKQIYLDSAQLRSDTAFGTPIRSRDSYGIMHVIVPLRSIVDKQLQVQYRVYFLDRNQNKVSEIGWTDKTLTAN